MRFLQHGKPEPKDLGFSIFRKDQTQILRLATPRW